MIRKKVTARATEFVFDCSYCKEQNILEAEGGGDCCQHCGKKLNISYDT